MYWAWHYCHECHFVFCVTQPYHCDWCPNCGAPGLGLAPGWLKPWSPKKLKVRPAVKGFVLQLRGA